MKLVPSTASFMVLSHFSVNSRPGPNVWPLPASVTSDAPIKAARAAHGHAGWILSGAVDVSVRTRGAAEERRLGRNTGGSFCSSLPWIHTSQRRSVFRATP